MSRTSSAASLLTMLGVMVVTAGCGRIDTVAQPDAATQTSPSKPVPVATGGYRIEFQAAGDGDSDIWTVGRHMSRLSFDLAVPHKNAEPQLNDGESRAGAQYSGSTDFQVRLIPIGGTQALCELGPSAELERAANLKLVAHDVVDITRLRVDFVLHDATEPFDPSVGVCYGTHAAGGGWTWSAGHVPIAFDSPSAYGGPEGSGHVDLPIEAKRVDMVSVVYNKRISSIAPKRMTYWATLSP